MVVEQECMNMTTADLKTGEFLPHAGKKKIVNLPKPKLYSAVIQALTKKIIFLSENDSSPSSF